jgi:hypothetical protein
VRIENSFWTTTLNAQSIGGVVSIFLSYAPIPLCNTCLDIKIPRFKLRKAERRYHHTGPSLRATKHLLNLGLHDVSSIKIFKCNLLTQSISFMMSIGPVSVGPALYPPYGTVPGLLESLLWCCSTLSNGFAAAIPTADGVGT